MSFAQLKKSSKTQFKQLADKMGQEGKGGSYNDDRFWEPDIDKSGSGFAIIRFLPAIEGAEMPYVKTFSHGFKNGTKWFIENCPTTIGQVCPVCEANSVLWETGNKENQDIVRKRKRQTRYISNIIVLSDSKRPQNEGKVFLYRYGSKIFTKLMNAIEPEFEDEKVFNPFDFWEGAPFKLKIRNVEGYRNYDKSEFGDCEPLFPEDSAMEKVWKSEYDLGEFLDPKQFKPYDEIKKKFLLTINAPAQATRKDDDGGDDNTPPEAEPKVERTSKASTAKTAAEDDDDFKLFSSLIDTD
jgi:hypothetical protein